MCDFDRIRLPDSKMSGVSTIDMVVVGTFLVISACVVGCMFLLNCYYYKQRHGHQSTILAHTLGSRPSCGYNRSSKHILTHTHTHSPTPLKTVPMKNSEIANECNESSFSYFFSKYNNWFSIILFHFNTMNIFTFRLFFVVVVLLQKCIFLLFFFSLSLQHRL